MAGKEAGTKSKGGEGGRVGRRGRMGGRKQTLVLCV